MGCLCHVMRSKGGGVNLSRLSVPGVPGGMESVCVWNGEEVERRRCEYLPGRTA